MLFNARVCAFPGSLVRRLGGFRKMGYFELSPVWRSAEPVTDRIRLASAFWRSWAQGPMAPETDLSDSAFADSKNTRCRTDELQVHSLAARAKFHRRTEQDQARICQGTNRFLLGPGVCFFRWKNG